MNTGAKQAIVIRHVLFEDLGLLGPILEDRGFRIRYLEAGLDGFGEEVIESDLLVVLGGPIGLGDLDRYPFLGEEIELIGRRLEAGGPTLGICLGAQLMAAALGASVKPTGRTEIGFAELELTPAGKTSVLAPLEGVPVLHWHGDEFQIPAGAERLAETEGFPNQAFSKGPEALALQFHVEADPERIEQWLIGHAGELVSAGVDPQELRKDAARNGDELARAAAELIDLWLDGQD